jgi:hypothetical protein
MGNKLTEFWDFLGFFGIFVARLYELTSPKSLLIFMLIFQSIIPINNPINAYTMAGIVKDAGLTIEEF